LAGILPLSVSFLTPLGRSKFPTQRREGAQKYRKHLEEARGDPAIHHQKQVAEIQGIGRMEVGVRAAA
jgi:hypothetical protein